MASSREIEREVEDQRAHVESTLEALRQKMSVGQMVDEVGNYIGTQDAKQALRNVGRQARDNPVALGLVGIGLAWLMFGGSEGRRPLGDGRSASGGTPAYSGEHGGGYGAASPGGGGRYGSAFGTPYDNERGASSPSLSSPSSSSSEGVVSRASEAASGAAHVVGERLSDAGARVRSALSNASDRMRGAADEGRARLSDLGERGGSYLPSGGDMSRRGRRAGGALAEALERQPLVVGALALGAGAIIGMTLPSTRSEDRWLGERRDDLVEEAREAAGDMRRQAVEAAKAGLRAAGEAAQEEGLAPTPQGRTLAEKVEHVVKAGVEETRRNIAPDKDAGPTGHAEPGPGQPNAGPRPNPGA